jgi:hypothetical protein
MSDTGFLRNEISRAIERLDIADLDRVLGYVSCFLFAQDIAAGRVSGDGEARLRGSVSGQADYFWRCALSDSLQRGDLIRQLAEMRAALREPPE